MKKSFVYLETTAPLKGIVSGMKITVERIGDRYSYEFHNHEDWQFISRINRNAVVLACGGGAVNP